MADPKPVRPSLRLDTLAAALQEKLDNEAGVLDLLLSGLARGQDHPAIWERLHDAALRDDRLAELAFAYERLSRDKKLKSLNPALQAVVLTHAGAFFAEVFGDADGAEQYLERAVALVPGETEAFQKLEAILQGKADGKKLGELYAAAAPHRARDAQLAMLRKAAELLARDGDTERAIKLELEVLKLDPADAAARAALEDLYERAGKLADLARLLEQSLAADPPPPAEDARSIRMRLLSLYAGGLGEIERATPHVEEILRAIPAHPAARKVAEELLAHKAVAARAAASLAAAHERTGDFAAAARMLAIEIDALRGPKRVDAQKRLAALTFERLGDRDKTFALDEVIVPLDPADHEVRARYVRIAGELGRLADATRVLARAASGSKDPAVRARIGVDLGDAYLGLGDARKARATYQGVLDARGGDDAELHAARALAAIFEGARDLKALAAVLGRVAELSPDPEAKIAATSRLAALSENDLGDQAGAIGAWRGLLGTRLEADALLALTRLYEATGAHAGLAATLEARAASSQDRAEARDLTFRAAEIRSEKIADRGAALEAWSAFIEAFGASREALGRLVPLLEHERRWEELASALVAEAALTPVEERAAVLARLGQLRLAKLGDARGSLDAHRQALALDPAEKQSRLAVDRMLSAGELRLEAADVLEPIVRAEGSAAALVRVLEARAALAEGARGMLAALAEASDVAQRGMRDGRRALDLATRGLGEAIAGAIDEAAWIERVERLTAGPSDAGRRAAALRDALGDRSVDSAPLAGLARRAGEALVASGDVAGALVALRRALAFDPSSAELLARIDTLLREQGSPEERLSLYRGALDQPCDPARRRELLHGIAAIERRDLGLPEAAAITYRRALADDPDDAIAASALLEIHEATGDWEALYAELDRVLARSEPGSGERLSLRLRMAEIAAARGWLDRAAERYADLVADEGAASDEVLAAAERVARDRGDAALLRATLERRVAVSAGPEDEATWLERLGELDVEASPASAATTWKRAGDAATRAGDAARAEALYERAMGAAPDDRDAAARLVELYRARGAWDRMPAAFAVLLGAATTAEEAARVLAAFEDPAVRAGEAARDRFVAEADAILARAELGALDRAVVRAARARVLAGSPARHVEAASAYRAILADGEGDVDAAARAFEAFLAARGADAAGDRRWLFGWRADRAPEAERVPLLLAWAEAEETALGDPAAAEDLYARIVAIDPDHDDALAARTKLLLARGDLEGAALSIAERRQRREGGARAALDLELAALLLDRMDRPLDALDAAASVLDATPGDAAALRLVERALARPEARARAAELLERAADAADGVEAATALLEVLLSTPADVAALRDARRGWFARLLDQPGTTPDRALEIAIRAASELPDDDALWARAEDLAREVHAAAANGEAPARTPPERVADAYRRALGVVAATSRSQPPARIDLGHATLTGLDPEQIEAVGRRAVEYQEEWFDDADMVAAMLHRIVELAPGSAWPFERLKLLYNLGERWDDLFALYDDALARAPDPALRRELLEDAAVAAKDLAGDSARAMGYLEALHALRPDPKTRAALERLYERHGRHRPLIDLLAAGLADLGADDVEAAQRIRARVAGLWLDGAGDADSAARVAEEMLDAGGAEAWRDEAYDVLERVMQRDATGAARQRAATRLADRYRALGRSDDLVRVLEIDLDGAAPTARAEKLRAIVRIRLGELGDEAGAFDGLAALVMIEPAVAGHRDALERLAERLGRWARLGEVLAAAAEKAEGAARIELFARAAEIHGGRLGDAARAIEQNRAILALAGDSDPAALAAAQRLDRLLAAAGRAEERCDVLDRLAALEADPAARRAARAEIARLARDEIHDLDRSIRALWTMLAADPADLEAERDLCRALEEAGRWDDLVRVLERRAARAGGEDARRDRARAARILDERLDRAADAIAVWSEIRARFGADDESADALAILYEKTSRWAELAELLDAEATATEDGARTADLLARTGDLHRVHTGDLGAAVAAYDLALEARAGDAAARRGLEALVASLDGCAAEGRPALIAAVGSLVRLYAATDAVEGTLALLEPRLTAASSGAERIAILTETAGLFETRAADPARAFDAAWRAFTIAVDDRGAGDPAERAPEVMRLADAADRWGFIAGALAAGGLDLPAPVARELLFRSAGWQRDRGDTASAEASLGRALALDPGSVPILETLAGVQRGAPGRALITTLLALASATGDLDRFREAVEVAEGPASDAALAKTLAEKMLDAAAELWTRAPEQAAAASAAASWALGALVRLVHDEGPTRVADLFLRGARLPFDTAERRRLRLRAAELAEGEATLGIYRELFDEDPGDALVSERLDALYRELGRGPERIAVRERQIAAAPDDARRVALRLDLADLLAESGDATRAIAVLRENLAAGPHAPSAERLAELLEAGGHVEDLCALTERRATETEADGDRAIAGSLWARAAALSEEQLADATRAIAALRRAAALDAPGSADALARLLLARGDHAAAAEVLETLCEAAPPATLAAAALRLADAYFAAGQPDAARTCLERASKRADDRAPLRARLASLYRDASAWGPLAELVAEDAADAPDRATRAARLREAADLHLTRRRDPAAAIPLLEQAAELSPDDLSVRLELAAAKTAAGRLDEAAVSLRAVITAYGTRRPKERAIVHYELAKVALATADRARALAELDAAVRIDPGHPAVLHALARLAFEEGQLERATRTYRALLLVVRKPRPDGSAGPVSRAEVLFELSELTRLQNEPDRAAEYLDSALEAARESETERDRLLDALRARGRHELLAQALEARLATGAGDAAAAILEELASLYEAHLARPVEALDARLRALALGPASRASLDAALDLARRSQQIERFIAAVRALAEAEADPDHAAALVLFEARALERDAADDARAADAYRRAEAMLAPLGNAARLAEVWRAEIGVLERIGDVAAQEALLARRIDAALDTEPADRADPIYRLAALRLRRGARDEGAALLDRALAMQPDADRAEATLRDALVRGEVTPGTPAPDDRPLALALERLAREYGRDRALADALVLLANLDVGAADCASTSLGLDRMEGLQEAAEIARGLADRSLLERVLRLALERSPIVPDRPLVWALVALADARAEAGDLAEAAELRERAARASAPDEERALLLDVARLAAGPLADLPRAARIFAELRAVDPAEREIWHPLADVYRRQGDRVRLAALLEETAPLVDSSAERARLRLERAKLAIDDDLTRAIPLLEEVLEENPSEVEAAMILSDLFERLGRREELAQLVARQLEAAKDRQDVPSIISLTLRLGPLLEQQWDEQGALDAYHTALDWDPKSRDVLRHILRLSLSRDDSVAMGDVMDRLLEVEIGEAAADLALRLAELRAATGDAGGALRALETGFAACPSNAQIKEALAARYAEGEAWRKLAALHERDADTREAREERVACLCRAADVMRERAGDAESAARILERALDLDLGDRDVLLALVDALSATGEHARAARAIDRVLAVDPGDPWLYRARASLHDALGDRDAALADLELAYEKSSGGYARELIDLLDVVAAAYAASADPVAAVKERATRLRLAEVLAAAGELDRARAELSDLGRKDGKDRAVLRALAELEERAERWDAASAAYRRLLVLEDGDALVDTALRLADACERGDRLGDARSALERAQKVAPASPLVRERLRAVYNVTGAARELAGMILEDAGALSDVAGRFALLVHAGRLLLDTEGEAYRAASVIEEAQRLRPEDPETMILLADAYTLAGRATDARAILDAAVLAQKGRRAKHLGAVHRRVARLDLAAGDRAAAIAALGRAFDNDPQNASIAMELGLLATELGDDDIATRAFRAVTLMKEVRAGTIPPPAIGDATPPAPRALAYYHLGRMAVSQGDRRKARLMIEKAVAEDPGLEPARALLDHLRAS